MANVKSTQTMGSSYDSINTKITTKKTLKHASTQWKYFESQQFAQICALTFVVFCYCAGLMWLYNNHTSGAGGFLSSTTPSMPNLQSNAYLASMLNRAEFSNNKVFDQVAIVGAFSPQNPPTQMGYLAQIQNNIFGAQVAMPIPELEVHDPETYVLPTRSEVEDLRRGFYYMIDRDINNMRSAGFSEHNLQKIKMAFRKLYDAVCDPLLKKSGPTDADLDKLRKAGENVITVMTKVFVNHLITHGVARSEAHAMQLINSSAEVQQAFAVMRANNEELVEQLEMIQDALAQQKTDEPEPPAPAPSTPAPAPAPPAEETSGGSSSGSGSSTETTTTTTTPSTTETPAEGGDDSK